MAEIVNPPPEIVKGEKPAPYDNERYLEEALKLGHKLEILMTRTQQVSSASFVFRVRDKQSTDHTYQIGIQHEERNIKGFELGCYKLSCAEAELDLSWGSFSSLTLWKDGETGLWYFDKESSSHIVNPYARTFYTEELKKMDHLLDLAISSNAVSSPVSNKQIKSHE